MENSSRAEILLLVAEATKGLTTGEIAKRTGQEYTGVKHHLTELRRARQVHISDWRYDYGAAPTAVYRAGAGNHAPRPPNRDRLREIFSVCELREGGFTSVDVAVRAGMDTTLASYYLVKLVEAGRLYRVGTRPTASGRGRSVVYSTVPQPQPQPQPKPKQVAPAKPKETSAWDNALRGLL